MAQAKPKDNVRWLVVGAGMAGQQHLHAIKHIPGAALAGVVSHTAPDGIAPVYATVEEALNKAAADAVIIATPHDTHLELVSITLQAGLPVLCEKPVGRTSADTEAIARLSAKTGVPIGVVLNQRACKHNRWVRQLIQADDLQIRSVAFRGILGPLGGWRIDEQRSGGGVLRTIGVHYLDLLCWWLGRLPEQLYAVTGGGAAEDRVAVAMSFADDAIGSVYLTTLREAGRRGPLECLIEAGDVRIEFADHEIVRVEGLPAPPPVETPDPALRFGPGHAQVLSEATRNLAQRKAFPVPLAEALPSLRLVDQAYRSAAQAVLD